MYTPIYTKDKNTGSVRRSSGSSFPPSPRSVLRAASSPIPNKVSKLRQRTNDFTQQRLKKAVDDAAFYKEKCKQLEIKKSRWKTAAQSLTHEMSFGDSARPQTPRSESRRVQKSPTRRKKRGARKKLMVPEERSTAAFVLQGLLAGALLWFLWFQVLTKDDSASTSMPQWCKFCAEDVVGLSTLSNSKIGNVFFAKLFIKEKKKDRQLDKLRGNTAEMLPQAM